MKKPVFLGFSTAIVTPFTGDAPDYEALGRLVDRQLRGGTAALTVCGTTGEASSMSARERREVVAFCVRRVNGKIPVIAGAGCNDTLRAVDYAKDAAAAGADALLVVTPYYNKTSQEGLISHYFRIADTVDLPLILYNVPSRTGMTIRPETYARLSVHPNIVGTKEASGSITQVLDTLCLCPEDFSVWSGNDADTVALMALGAKGVISVAGNLIPEKMAELAGLCLRGEYAAAAALQRQLRPLESALFSDVNPIPVKTALNQMGLCDPAVRMPLVEPSAAVQERIREALIKLNIL